MAKLSCPKCNTLTKGRTGCGTLRLTPKHIEEFLAQDNSTPD